MARLARVIVPGLPHHVTQRGNRREPIFFEDGDQEVYRDLLAAQTARRGVEVWAYCLMPNHVHLILTPGDEAGIGLAVGEALGPLRRLRRHLPRKRGRIADIPTSSTPEADGQGICSRAGSPR